MAFGGFGSGGGGGGFGSNTNQSTGFGGFGSANTSNQSPGFGAPAAGGGFGQTGNTGGGIFGGGQSSTGGGFGSGSGTFGSNTQNTSLFNKPAFGSGTTSSSSLFGGGTATTGGGSGFGGGFGNTGTSGGFGTGTSNTGGGVFGGGQKSAFGGGTGGTNAFGTSGQGTGTFGASPSAFGGGSGTAFNQPTANNGTGQTQFQVTSEKDGASGTAQYQSISFMPPYQNFSFEELRVVDYSQGRKYGNENGQAGGFGKSTGFGGFGAGTGTSTSGFGATSSAGGGGMFGTTTTNTSSPFGGGQTQQSGGFGGGFGNNAGATGTGGGLFGAASKPGGLFGATPATTSQPSGGMFGATNTTTSGGLGGGLFGAQNQTQNKTAFGGGFGGGALGGGTGFGQTTSSGGGLFGGATSTAPAFGSQQGTPGGGFGGQQGQQPTQTQNQGGIFSGFGNATQQQKPGAFGATPAAGGASPFGQAQQQQPSGGLFGASTQQPSGGLFGAKPAAPSPFGASTGTQQPGAGLFQNAGPQQQTQPTGGLFGATQPKPTFGAFGGSTGTSTGGGLFGGAQANTNQQPGGLFGSQQNQQQSGGSLFGGSQQNQQQQQQPSSLTASLMDNPYGNLQLFQSLATPAANVGPLATPLSSSQKLRKQAILPQHKINPNASTRLITPQKRPSSYGFSYSTYGTPSSASSNASPGGFGASFLGTGSFGRSLGLGKSLSTSNLRHTYNAEDSLLAPGFLNNSLKQHSTGGAKRLQINRGLDTRRSLFGPDRSLELQSPLKKKVSFDADADPRSSSSGADSMDTLNGAVIRRQEDRHPPAINGASYMRPRPDARNGAPVQPPMEQVGGITGKELAIVPENESPPTADASNQVAISLQVDQKPGTYWTSPPVQALKGMTREQLKNVRNFTVGRVGVGHIEFGDVDLSNIGADRIAPGIVVLEVRRATVYGRDCGFKKPPVGHGLNVPSVITLENSWPRSKRGSAPVLEKKGSRIENHIKRLMTVEDTEYMGYDVDKGIWRFKVQHYTTYGLEYEDEETGDGKLLSSAFDAAPMDTTPDKPVHTQVSVDSASPDISMMSPGESSPEDTFQFKTGLRNGVPGGFSDDAALFEESTAIHDDIPTMSGALPFLGDGSVLLPADTNLERDSYLASDGMNFDVDQNMAGSFPAPDNQATEPSLGSPLRLHAQANGKPKSILKHTLRDFDSPMDTPAKSKIVIGADWAEQLQNTVSPKKRDRQALRDTQASALRTLGDEPTPKERVVSNGSMPFTTSIDIMNSLFGGNERPNGIMKKSNRQAVESPASKKSRPSDRSAVDTAKHLDRSFSGNTSWNPDGTLVMVGSLTGHSIDGILRDIKAPVRTAQRDIRFVKFDTDRENFILNVTDPRTRDFMSSNKVNDAITFKSWAKAIIPNTPARTHEYQTWRLASILFDDITDALPTTFNPGHQHNIFMRIRKDNLAQFWREMVRQDMQEHLAEAEDAEERALIYLSGGDIVQACAVLLEARDYKLATMVSQLSRPSAEMQDAISQQLETWQKQDTLSEIKDSIRAIYELLAGHTCMCDGGHNIGAENRAATFNIAERFHLDWRRSFGLRLWYGLRYNDSIEMAVQQFAEELGSKQEQATPVPWYVERQTGLRWEDPNINEREDLLWGLLKLFAGQRVPMPGLRLDEILAVENVSSNPLDCQLPYNMIHMLRARDITATSADSDKENRNAPSAIAPENEDDTANKLSLLMYTSLLNSPVPSTDKTNLARATWRIALYPLIKLTEPLRSTLIQNHLVRFAGEIPTLEADPFYNLATSHFNIPRDWIFAALATHARSVQQAPDAQAHYLMRASLWTEAHAVLCADVAPKAIIEKDYDRIREILGTFVDAGGKDAVDGWETGGGLYFNFVYLTDLIHVTAASERRERRELVARLGNALGVVAGEQRGWTAVRRAAVSEMARVVAGEVERDEALAQRRSQFLRYPLTEDATLRHTMDLSLSYYKSLMAGG
ncbi:hypothetical protein P152DRAFT_457191 [Eremomyces bilateralis CBS 781.70]|uniref:Peptidase S59 domain-containing protein n=1 Tax=Eremomyces bilateralis CBS 781.70 TaxID=1392243 RepID=A0A6G1G730_9PEZI|nr:uncharacterized protein P152DRAFT_457191 [Eremomyces bilateralis CBS 781.70]KAF1813822.1 hypothetical protein P152DRAFT_457191 [Eremomyces bilateralis CBS 781.70]